MKGVITGDIVNSTKIPSAYKQTVIDALNGLANDFSRTTAIRLEMFRGDSFQIVVSDIAEALSVAIAVRARLQSSTPTGCDVWDARVALGVGGISYESDSILTSDGEAFRLSGRAFDSLGKRRLDVATPWQDVDESLRLNTRFADDIITSWTPKKAQAVYMEIVTGMSQKDLAAHIGMSPQNLNYIWNSSRCALILEYIERYKKLITTYRNS